jgi:hypothetical protein
MAAGSGSATIYDDVTSRLQASGQIDGALALWDEIQSEFRDNGPEAIKALIEKRVKQLRTAANKDLKASRDVAREVAPPKRKTAARGSTTKRPPRSAR